MASQKVIDYVSKYSRDYSTEKLDMTTCLRDFTDEQIKKILLPEEPLTMIEFLHRLSKTTEDKDIKAHLYGYETYQILLDEVKKAIKELR